jgi:NAD kinase
MTSAGTLGPRAILVHRRSEYDELVARHGTARQVEFFLAQRGRSLEDVRRRDERQDEALRQVAAALPASWRRGEVERADLSRFAFAPEDVVLVVGQDGLVANVAKYLDGQPVIGLNPDATVLGHPPEAAADLIADVAARRARIAERTMVEARLDDGQLIRALNEVFVGHVTHQSARYSIAVDGRTERQSSSGVVVATGTGSTGWAASLNRQLAHPLELPGPHDADLAFFVREAWPSALTGTSLTAGRVASLTVICELSDGGVVFGDGIEADRITADWGQRIEIGASERRLRLVE